MRTDVKLAPWHIALKTESPHDDFAESLFYCGNGRLGARAYLPVEAESRPVQAGLYATGFFDEIKPGITDIVHIPTPICERVFLNDAPAHIAGEKGARRTLNLANGTLEMQWHMVGGGVEIKVLHERFFSLADRQWLAQKTTFMADAPCQITLQTGTSLASCNCPVPDDQVKESTATLKLTREMAHSFTGQGYALELETLQSGLGLSQQTEIETAGFTPGQPVYERNSFVGLTLKATLSPGKEYVVEKLTGFTFTGEPYRELVQDCRPNQACETLAGQNEKAWQDSLHTADIEIEGDDELQCGIRYAIAQLIMNQDPENSHVSIGARGLTHARYKGCVFWDTDFFLLPFYLYTNPAAACALARFRINTLPAAKRHAKGTNSPGARYPWMVSLTGEEQCESWDIGLAEVHVTADVAFGLCQYIETTGDEALAREAAEVLVETARFWAGRYTRGKGGVPNLLFVKGPDEYCGITSNNLFTGHLVKRNLCAARAAAEKMRGEDPVRYEALKLGEEELEAWLTLAREIPTPRSPETGELQQDDTFHLLEPVNIADIKANDAASYHEVCFDRLQRYRVVKQADLLLLMSRCPEDFTPEEKAAAWREYEPLCLHDSTLSFASHALFAAQNGYWQKADTYFAKALHLDLANVMQNTGKEGLHLANFGELWQAFMFGYCGIRSGENGITVKNHRLPGGATRVRCKIVWRGTLHEITLGPEAAEVKAL